MYISALATIHRIPFSLISQSRHLHSISVLLSDYRKTSFSVQDGLSEWRGDGRLHIAEYNGELAGIMRLDERRTYWGLSSFVVNPRMRGNGIGGILMNSTEDLDKPIYLKVQQDNAALALYQRHRFEIMETLDDRHHMKRFTNAI